MPCPSGIKRGKEKNQSCKRKGKNESQNPQGGIRKTAFLKYFFTRGKNISKRQAR
jgi:hypothetical protein